MYAFTDFSLKFIFFSEQWVLHCVIEKVATECSKGATGKMLYKKAVLKNFQIFTGKHLCRSLFLIKFIKKRLQHRCSPMNIAKFLKESILKNISERLLLNDGNSLPWIKSWKPPIIAQYDAQPQRIKRLIVLLFLKTLLIVLKRSFH